MVLNTARRAAERESRDGPRSAQPRQIFSDAKRSRDVFSAIRAALRSAFGRSVEIDAPPGRGCWGRMPGKCRGGRGAGGLWKPGSGRNPGMWGGRGGMGPIRPGSVGEGPSRMVGRVPGWGRMPGKSRGGRGAGGLWKPGSGCRPGRCGAQAAGSNPAPACQGAARRDEALRGTDQAREERGGGEAERPARARERRTAAPRPAEDSGMFVSGFFSRFLP